MRAFLTPVVLSLVATCAWSEPAKENRTIIDRDRTYEENLRWNASDDKAMTPVRALRWIRGVRGSAIFAPVKPADIQPIVNVENSYVRAVATIAYKF